MKKEFDNTILDNILHLVVGENIPDNAPKEFSIVKLYVRDNNGSLEHYATLSLPYLINHSEFIGDIEDDPRYYFMEGYDPRIGSCSYMCEVKPFGDMKGVYRILDGRGIKILEIEPLNEKANMLIKKA